MLRHLNRSTGLGSFFGYDVASSSSSSYSSTSSNHAAEMLVPIDILSGGGGATKATGAIGFSHLRLARSLKSQIENHRIDKSSLMESLKQSKVTATKEPSEWDWERINNLLDGPLAYNPSALWEVVRNTKFMKRLGGFFRCDPGEKGYFGHLPWTPKNCERYVQIVGQMLNVLMSTNEQGGAMYISGNRGVNGEDDGNNVVGVGEDGGDGNELWGGSANNRATRRRASVFKPGGERDTAGLQFLRDDRRGQLVKEITTHLSSIIDYIDGGRDGGKGGKGKKSPKRTRMRMNRVGMFIPKREGDSAGTPSSTIPNDGTSGSDLVFSRCGTISTMAREYFTILGQLSTTDIGLQLLSESGLFRPAVFALAEDSTKDYLSRQLVSHLDCAHPGPARDLLQYWLTSSSTSTDLRLHCVNVVLRGLLRRGRVVDFAQWGVEMLVTQLQFGSRDMRVAAAALRVLNEAACIREYLEALIKLRPPLKMLTTPSAGMLLFRMLTVPTGFNYLHHDVEWVDSALSKWSMFGESKQTEIDAKGVTDEEGSNAEAKKTKDVNESQKQLTENGCCRYARHMDGQLGTILMRDRRGGYVLRKHQENRMGGERTQKTTTQNGEDGGEIDNNDGDDNGGGGDDDDDDDDGDDGSTWNNSPIPIPVIASGGSARGESAESNSGVWLNRNSLGHMVSGSGGESSGSDLDWLIRLPWHVVIWARDQMGWREIPTDAHLALGTLFCIRCLLYLLM